MRSAAESTFRLYWLERCADRNELVDSRRIDRITLDRFGTHSDLTDLAARERIFFYLRFDQAHIVFQNSHRGHAPPGWS